MFGQNKAASIACMSHAGTVAEANSDRKQVDALLASIRGYIKEDAPRKCINSLDNLQNSGLDKDQQAEVTLHILALATSGCFLH